MTDHVPAPRPPAPGTVPPIPRMPAIERLFVTLKQSGESERAARAIAFAVVDPAGFRRAMQAPVQVNTASGELIMVHTRVWTPSVIPHPMNVRLSPRMPYSFSGVGHRTMGRAVGGPDEAAELVVSSPGRDAVVSALAQATALLAAENPLADEIGIDGVIEPITLVPLTFEVKENPSADVTVLAAVDGSSRVAGAYANLGIEAEQVVFRYATDPAALRGRIGRWLRMTSADPADLDDADIRQLNSLTMPAMVIIGFKPTEAWDTAATFARAVDARVGAIHVAPPSPWSRAAQHDAQLNAVLDALEAEGHLDREQAAYYAGDVSPAEAEARGLPTEADERSVLLLAELHRPKHVRTIHEALRAVAIRKPGVKDRAAVAAEGALRAFRNEIPAAQADVARNLLVHLYAMDEFRNASWHLYGDGLTAIVDAALDGDDDAARSLLGLAIYWMARFSTVRRTTRGGESDRRDISAVLRLLLDDTRGLKQLHRIVLDGRKGRPPRRVSASGNGLLKSPSGQNAVVSEEWLRRTWGDDSHTENETPSKSPEAELLRRFERIRGDVANLVVQVEGLVQPIGDDGQPIVFRLGLSPQVVDEVLQQWATQVAGPLTHYRYIADQSSQA